MSPRRPAWAPQDERARELDGKILRGSAWVALSWGGAKLLSLVSMLALVRLVEPSAFGLTALAWSFLTIATQVQGAGLSSAVIFHRERLTERAATAAAFVLVSSVALFGVALVAAPYVAELYRADGLTNVFRALAGALVLNALATIPGALLEREIRFHLRAKAELGGAVVQLGVSIATAAIGWGVWALVAGQLAGSAVLALGNWILVPDRPDLRKASWREVRPLIRYGRSVTAANCLNIVNRTIDNAIVGRMLGTGSLGFYAITFRLAEFPNSVIGYVVGRVMFPVYARLRGDMAEFRRTYVQNLQRVALLAFPVSVILAVASEPLVVGLLGERWRPVVEPLRILAAYGLVKSITAPSGEVMKAVGRPSVNVGVGLVYVAIVTPGLLLLVPRYGLDGAAISMLAATVLGGGWSLYLSLRAVGLSVGELAAALAPSAACSAVLGGAIAMLQLPTSGFSPVVALVVLLVAGLAVYAASTAVIARSIVATMWVSLRGAR